jgi:hypothetical protein
MGLYGHNFNGYNNYHMNNHAQIQHIHELNCECVKDQDKDIEIERLQTTCSSLMNKASIVDDQAMEIQTLIRRIAESEKNCQVLSKFKKNLEQEKELNQRVRNRQ